MVPSSGTRSRRDREEEPWAPRDWDNNATRRRGRVERGHQPTRVTSTPPAPVPVPVAALTLSRMAAAAAATRRRRHAIAIHSIFSISASRRGPFFFSTFLPLMLPHSLRRATAFFFIACLIRSMRAMMHHPCISHCCMTCLVEAAGLRACVEGVAGVKFAWGREARDDDSEKEQHIKQELLS